MTTTRPEFNSSRLSVGISVTYAKRRRGTSTVCEAGCAARVLSASSVDPLECVAIVRRSNETQWSRSLADNVERARRLALRRVVERVVGNGALRFRRTPCGSRCCLVCGLPPASCTCTVTTIRRYASALIRQATPSGLMHHLVQFGADRYSIAVMHADGCVALMEHMEWATWASFRRVVADRLRGGLMLALLAHRHTDHQKEACCICGSEAIPCECTTGRLRAVVDRWIALSPDAVSHRKLLAVEDQ